MKSGDERWAVKLPDGEWHPYMHDIAGLALAKDLASTYRQFDGIEATVVRVRVVIEEVESEVRGDN
jgi:hypothetical protein